MVSVHLYQCDTGSHSSRPEPESGFITTTLRVGSAHPWAPGADVKNWGMLTFILKWITKMSIPWQGVLISLLGNNTHVQTHRLKLIVVQTVRGHVEYGWCTHMAGMIAVVSLHCWCLPPQVPFTPRYAHPPTQRPQALAANET